MSAASWLAPAGAQQPDRGAACNAGSYLRSFADKLLQRSLELRPVHVRAGACAGNYRLERPHGRAVRLASDLELFSLSSVVALLSSVLVLHDGRMVFAAGSSTAGSLGVLGTAVYRRQQARRQQWPLGEDK
jgi:hypothetical protein